MIRITLPLPGRSYPVFAEERFVAEARGRARPASVSAHDRGSKLRHAPWSPPRRGKASRGPERTGTVFGFIKHAAHWAKKHWKQIAIVAAAVTVAVVVTVATGGLADVALAAGLPAFLGTAGSVF